MIFDAIKTSDGAFILGMLYSDEFSLINPVYFLLDTGSAISALSVKDLGGIINYSGLEKKREAAFGVGGALECYLIHNIRLFLLSAEQRWIDLKNFTSMCLLPSSTDEITHSRIFLPSIIGRDILGVDLDLTYSREGVFLKS
ncbi:hypothetical protein LCGC14_2018290 [marine sediment metagenome]|uniref:Peptidase A2 domain-containing protein n=1 Tax=marine sediment metagenome TaxID=412755 RepID=A0A0F9HVE4_9ZZZZ